MTLALIANETQMNLNKCMSTELLVFNTLTLFALKELDFLVFESNCCTFGV